MKNDREKEMERAFWHKANSLLLDSEQFVKPGKIVRVGLEEEIAIYKKGLSPNDYEQIRDEIVAQNQEWTDVELGTSQIEIRTLPTIITNGGLCSLVDAYNERLAIVTRFCREKGCVVLRTGANPFLPIDKIQRTNREKYQLVPSHHDANRRAGINTIVGSNGGIDIGQAAIVSLFQSFQINLEAESFEDAIEKLNYSLMIGPQILALATNSRFLNLQDTGISDIRMPAWEISHDVRTLEEINSGQELRVGLPERYFIDMKDYFNRTARFPFILYDPEHALEIGIGLHWTDTRIKVIGNSLVVEFRLIPTQPHLSEEIGLMLLWIGRIVYAQKAKEALLPFNYVRENRTSVINHGLSGKAWRLTSQGLRQYSTKVMVADELELAIAGLKEIGLYHAEFVESLMERLHKGTPSDLVCQGLGRSDSKFSEESLFNTFCRCGMIVE